MNLQGMRGAAMFAGVVVVAFLTWILLEGGCTPLAPAPAPSSYPAGDAVVIAYPDDSPQALSSPCGQACANLRRLACKEGGSDCYRACTKQVSLERVPIACWTKAPTQADVRACGPQLRCLP